VSSLRTQGSTRRAAGARSQGPRSAATPRPGAATAPPRPPGPARRIRARTTGTARANARRPRRPAQAEAAAGACPHDRADHHGLDPSASRPNAAAPREDPGTAEATSFVNSGSADVRAQPPEPRDAGSPRPAHPPATTTRPPSHDHHQRSPRPQPAPHHKIRRLGRGPSKGLNAYALPFGLTCTSSRMRWVWSRLWSFQVSESTSCGPTSYPQAPRAASGRPAGSASGCRHQNLM